MPVLTLTGNGNATSTTITTAQTVVYAGKYTNGGLPVPNATVGLKVFHGLGCGTGQDLHRRELHHDRPERQLLQGEWHPARSW